MLALIYALFDPGLYPFPRCLWLSLTGFRCPGCGLQRSLHALLTGNPAEVLHYNWALALILPVLIIYLIGYLGRRHLGSLYVILTSRRLLAIWALLTLLWWVGRNLWDL